MDRIEKEFADQLRKEFLIDEDEWIDGTFGNYDDRPCKFRFGTSQSGLRWVEIILNDGEVLTIGENDESHEGS